MDDNVEDTITNLDNFATWRKATYFGTTLLSRLYLSESYIWSGWCLCADQVFL